MLKVKYVLALVVAMFLAVSTCFAASDELLVAHVKVTMRDASAQGKPPCVVDQGHSRALAETLGAARDVYVQLGFDMPEIVNLSITCGGDRSPTTDPS
jgi:hypothetical protein